MKRNKFTRLSWVFVFIGLSIGVSNCTKKQDEKTSNEEEKVKKGKSDIYTTFRLEADLSGLSENQKKMIPLLIDAAKLMDDIFWQEAYGDKEALLNSIDDEDLRKFALINYGPWDRLDGDTSFIEGVGAKPLTANFYPHDMTKDEFEAADLKDKSSQYTMLRRDSSGALFTTPYHEFFEEKTKKAASLLEEAATLAEDEGFKRYLQLRAKALRTDNYYDSDMAWMDMKTNQIDVVIGPIENYEDKLYNYKTAHEAYVLIKDMEWSDRLAKYAAFLPELQEGLPVDPTYKQEKPGTDADLNAYDVVYYAGDCNAGSKTIAINLPNDERVQLAKGSRRLQLKNAMRAKFDKILVPISEVLIDPAQRDYITFDAFFANTMFHEVAHGLGIKMVVGSDETVRRALKENYSAIEEGKADILGLYMITELIKKGELEGELKEYYVTFMTSIFRSVRFGASSAHGKANMVRFNFFKELGAFTYDEATGFYSVNFDKMQEAVDQLSAKLLVIQGNGDYDGAGKLFETQGIITDGLQRDLDELNKKGIPVDIIFEQGVDVLKLN